MAILLNTKTGEKVILTVQHVFGRYSATSNTMLYNEDASRMHAIIFWEEEQWRLKDVSTNGTFVNGSIIIRDTKNRLCKGDKIIFGSIKSDTWELLSVDAPRSMLFPLTPKLPTIELNDIIALPSEDLPEVMLYLTIEGLWTCESQSDISVLKSGDLVEADKKIWRFIDVKPSDRTQTTEQNHPAPPSEIKFFFQVSQNEEHVSLTLKIDKQKIELGERIHHYLLLVLARQRLADKASGLIEQEQGWINKEVLSGMLGLTEDHVNIQIYRFRRQLANALPRPLTLHQTIERRAGELRFAFGSIQIDGGQQTKSHNERLKTTMA